MINESMQIRVTRAILGWSKVRMAQQIGVSVHTYGNWEAGRFLPRPKNRLALANFRKQYGIAILPDSFRVTG